ncbi:MAG: Eco57I restriction-modification methylase domain-containing protein [Candidatus Theseobacter exili]|nr:Eco57I restriction-modification methylase domain-containing protein [Candidatus Theseobacter exili]
MTLPEIIHTLVKRFDDNLKFYKSKDYNEAQLRQEFLDPFFEALGWDVYNKKDFAPRYREVIVEKPISFQGTQASKTPDYAFRLAENPKFFVEAKRPNENLESSAEFAFQLKAYAWNKHLPLSILTDFEEFLVFDCRRKPKKSDRPDVDCVMKLTYTDYLEKWDQLTAIFSPDSIRKGAFDKYAEDNTSKKGVTEVDDEFLNDISAWRELLARNIALRNKEDIDEANLNYAVQMTIDRIIFLRICEDRGIEPFNQLRELTENPDIYQYLQNLFKRAELKFNSGLFTFKNHKKNTTHQDNLTPSLTIDDKVLKQIISSLYYPASTYNFKAIPVEILGQVYEQFLGKVIRLTPAHQAKIEDKPEVRKAGGVYYTPKYIVDYIVANTVGKLLEGKTPDQVSQLKIVDPACGSGSFLLGAFQYLMNWYEEWYLSHNPEKWVKGKEPTLSPIDGGDFRLSTPEKKRILINNIFGVDIDHQAVEVTKLSLLLKVLEEETGQLSLGLEHALPDLGDNIKCGNSLIGWDYFEGQLLPDQKEIERVNPFDWYKQFPQVFLQGGFDVVIGNPPYIRIQTMNKNDKEYFSKAYETTIGNYDIYCPFLERGFKLLNNYGVTSFILPHRFFKTDYGEGLRAFLAKNQSVKKIVDFDGFMVFDRASINTCIIVLSKTRQEMFDYAQIHFLNNPTNCIENILGQIDFSESINNQSVTAGKLPTTVLTEAPWIFIFNWETSIWANLLLIPQKLKDVSSQIFQGLKTGSDAIFSMILINKGINESEVLCSFDNKTYLIENSLLFKQVKGGDMKRYRLKDTQRVVFFPYKEGKLINRKTMQQQYTLAWNFLISHKSFLEQRENGKMHGDSWYGYTRNQALTSMNQKKSLLLIIMQVHLTVSIL